MPKVAERLPIQRREASSAHRKVAVMIFLFSPLVVVTLLCVAIARSLNDPTIHKMEARGAGAGQTGGANALGEYLKHRREAVPVAQPVSNGAAPSEPATAPQPASATQAGIDPATLEQGFIVVIRDTTGKSSASSPIYFASALTGWNPKDEAFRFTPGSDMRWRLHITKEMMKGASAVEFKFTRGAWDVEELNADFSVPGNKRIPNFDAAKVTPGKPPEVEYTIVAWSDTNPDHLQAHIGEAYKPLSVTGDVRRLQVVGGVGNEGKPRDLLVWLPPGYDAPENAARQYPVLYLHDGQNIFEKHNAIPAEWNADEIATKLVSSNECRPFIIVGVPSGPARMSEYLPVAALEGVEPRADAHVQWLVHSVMPRVERAFRVATGPTNTCVGGSSLGGAVSLYAATSFPKVFGTVLLESLPLVSGRSSAWNDLTEPIKVWPAKVYIGVGDSETGAELARAEANRRYLDASRVLAERARAALGESAVKFQVDAGAVHNESAWAKRLPVAFKFLFPAE